ncbi:MAG TPA: hypothetical protein VGK73_00775 [Polyangiaceae bacterium]
MSSRSASFSAFRRVCQVAIGVQDVGEVADGSTDGNPSVHMLQIICVNPKL